MNSKVNIAVGIKSSSVLIKKEMKVLTGAYQMCSWL